MLKYSFSQLSKEGYEILWESFSSKEVDPYNQFSCPPLEKLFEDKLILTHFLSFVTGSIRVVKDNYRIKTYEDATAFCLSHWTFNHYSWDQLFGEFYSKFNWAGNMGILIKEDNGQLRLLTYKGSKLLKRLTPLVRQILKEADLYLRN